jgi:integrating conjugative element protein (TIGR03749 family)
MKYILTLIIASFCVSSALANGFESLSLTDSEIQKLKKYFPNEDNNRLVWNGEPIQILLPMGKEKRLVFPTHVTTSVKETLIKLGNLRVLDNDKSIYLTALKAFPKTRIYATMQDSGQVIFIDLATSENADSATQYIEIKQKPRIKEEAITTKEVIGTTTEPFERPIDVTYVDLIRYAWKEVYAPLRLLSHASYFARAPMGTSRFVFDLIYGDKVIAHPSASWRAGDSYVTSVSLINKYQHPIKIDIKQDLCGDWEAATLYPRSILSAQGVRLKDHTTLFLVSKKPFGKALGTCHDDA